MVPVAAGAVVPPARTELMLVVAMAVPAVPVAGPVAVTVGENLATTVSDMVPPQVEVAVLLLASPPYEAYHQ